MESRPQYVAIWLGLAKVRIQNSQMTKNLKNCIQIQLSHA